MKRRKESVAVLIIADNISHHAPIILELELQFRLVEKFMGTGPKQFRLE